MIIERTKSEQQVFHVVVNLKIQFNLKNKALNNEVSFCLVHFCKYDLLKQITSRGSRFVVLFCILNTVCLTTN